MTVYKLYNFYNVWADIFLYAYKIRAWKGGFLRLWSFFQFEGNNLSVQGQYEMIQYSNSGFVFKR